MRPPARRGHRGLRPGGILDWRNSGILIPRIRFVQHQPRRKLLPRNAGFSHLKSDIKQLAHEDRVERFFGLVHDVHPGCRPGWISPHHAGSARTSGTCHLFFFLFFLEITRPRRKGTFALISECWLGSTDRQGLHPIGEGEGKNGDVRSIYIFRFKIYKVRPTHLYFCHRYSWRKLSEIGKRFGIRLSGVTQASRRTGLKAKKRR